MEHLVYSLEHDTVAAEGEAIIVCVDYNKNCKAAIPDLYREHILSTEPITPEVFE